MQLRVKDLPKVHTLRMEWDYNRLPSGRKAPNLPLSHHPSQQTDRNLSNEQKPFNCCAFVFDGHERLRLLSAKTDCFYISNSSCLNGTWTFRPGHFSPGLLTPD